MSEVERCDAPLNIPLCGRALRSVTHGQSKRSANVPLTLTGKPNPAQIPLWHNISLVGLIVFFFSPFMMKFVTVIFQGDFQLALFQINLINLNVLNKKIKKCFWSHLANLPKKFNNWKSRLYLIFIRPTYFHENTASVIVQQNIQNTHTRWNKCT